VKGWGIQPREWAFAKSIAGDPGDGVPGIKGIGLLGAAAYIRKELTGRKLELIESEEGQEIIRRNLQLVGLPFAAKRRIQIDFIHEDEVFRREPFEQVFRELGFESFLKGFGRWEKLFGLQKRRRLL
jgi:5'-3' exonuclease